ncbi:MAG: hypothetical protein PHI31_14990 [Desulfuromonadaceae bacterium]|nr:hypothetical protein [Desulfuromonadaceae bacterium]
MKKKVFNACIILAGLVFLGLTVMQPIAHARVGGSRSMGSSGSRSYSRPASPYSQSGPSRQQAAPAPNTFQQQPAGGGFMRSMAGGLAGGMLGSMLFGGSAGAGGGVGGSSGGISMFEIILLAGGGYLLYRYIKKKKADADSDQYGR